MAMRQPKGAKTEIKIHVTKWKHRTNDESRSAGHRARTMWKETFETARCFVAPINEINSKSNLANFIFRHMGNGTFLVMAFNPKLRNKRYSKKFNCRLNKCQYHPDNFTGKEYWDEYSGKFKTTRPCSRYKRFQKGFSCKLNRKYIRNWDKRADIIIDMEKNYDGTFNERGYKFTYCRMHYFRWFWKG